MGGTTPGKQNKHQSMALIQASADGIGMEVLTGEKLKKFLKANQPTSSETNNAS